MTRFINYMLEAGNVGSSGKKAISREETKALLTSPQFSSALAKFKKGFIIYRGFSSDYPSFHFPKEARGTRTSANTRNYCTLFFDNTELWSEFPKRSKSLICSTSERYSRGYGNIYFIFPENGSKIGICPKDDIFVSFPALGVEHISELNWVLHAYKFHEDISFISQIKDTVVDLENGPLTVKNGFYKILTPFVGKSWYEALSTLLSPKTSGFKLETIETFNIKRDENYGNEIWMDGTCVAVTYQELKALGLV